MLAARRGVLCLAARWQNRPGRATVPVLPVLARLRKMGRAKQAASGLTASKHLKDFVNELYRRSPVTAALLPLSEEQYAGFVEVFVPKSFSLGLLVQDGGYLERLAWGGDRVLGHVVSDYLLETMPVGNDEDREQEYQSRVNNKMLHHFVAPRLGLIQFVAENDWGCNSRSKIGADLFEALVYKIEKNHGFEVVKYWVRQAALPIIEEFLSQKAAISHGNAVANLKQISKSLDSLLVTKSCRRPRTAVENTTAGDDKLPAFLSPGKSCRPPGGAFDNKICNVLKLDEGTSRARTTALAVVLKDFAINPAPAAVRSLPLRNPKGHFLELVQRSGCSDPVWDFSKSGEDHNPLHRCLLTYLGYSVTSKPWTRKKEAEQEACYLMIKRLQDASRA